MNDNTTTSPEFHEKGFPLGTPVNVMTFEQQAAYWRHHARKHERDYENRRAEAVKISAEAEAWRSHTRQQDAAAVPDDLLRELFHARFEVAAARRFPGKDMKLLASHIDPGSFAGDDGRPDPDLIESFFDQLPGARR